ncbi:MAG: hypothetical protein PW843_02695 [Azospirillaceae bacterium]|nr:hypothetical protein [Azospirillaceae bacterium]
MSNLINRITAWWLGEGPEDSQPQNGARVGAGQPITPDAGPDDFQERLGAILDHQSKIAAGSVQMLGLESLRDRLGPRWGAVRDRVHQLADRLINQALGPSDVVFPYGPDTYLVVFSQMDERAASLLCARVLQDLQRLLLGDADTASIVVRTAVRQVSGDLVLKPHRLADLLSSAARTGALSMAGGATTGGGGVPAHWKTTADAGPRTGQGPAGRLVSDPRGDGVGDPQWGALPSQGGGRAPPGYIPVPPGAPKAAGAFVVTDDGPLPAFSQSDVTAAWAAQAQSGPLEIVYRPVWDATHQALCLYITRGRRLRRGGQATYGYDAIPQINAPGPMSAETLQAILDMDEEAVRQAIAAYLELYDNRFRFFLSLPVHYETLAGVQRRRSYVALASRIPAHLIPFLTYHLVGLPDGTPTGRLADFVMALKPFGRNLMVGVDFGRQDLATLATAGVKGVGIILPSLGAHERLALDRLATELGLMAAEARRNRLKLYVEGVDTVELEAMVDRVGADFVAGDLIGGWTETPEHIVRMSRRELLSNTRPPP